MVTVNMVSIINLLALKKTIIPAIDLFDDNHR